MKKRLGKLLTIIAIAVLAATVLTACGGKNAKKDYDYLVTFDYNVGDMVTSCKTQYLGVMEGKTVAMKPEKTSSTFPEGAVEGYFLEGWYTAKLDADGNPVVGSDKKVLLDKKWNFESDRVTSDITLYANWVGASVLRFVDIDTGDETIKDQIMRAPGYSQKIPTSAPEKDGYTFYGYYADEEGTEEFAWPYIFEEGTKTVYVKFIAGTNWSIVKTAADFVLRTSGSGRVYLDADIDLTGSNWTPTAFSGKLYGNGHKITGLSVNLVGSANNNSGFAALFGEIGATAEIKDIVVEAAEVNFRNDASKNGISYTVGFFAYKANKGAKISNVAISGTLNYTVGGINEVNANKWIGIDETDAEDVTDVNYDAVNIVEK